MILLVLLSVLLFVSAATLGMKLRHGPSFAWFGDRSLRASILFYGFFVVSLCACIALVVIANRGKSTDHDELL